VTLENVLRTTMRARFFTPAGLLLRAGLLGATFLALSAAGLRDFAGALSFSAPLGVPPFLAAAGCAVYLVFYFAWVLVVPVLVIAAALLAAFEVCTRGRPTATRDRP